MTTCPRLHHARSQYKKPWSACALTGVFPVTGFSLGNIRLASFAIILHLGLFDCGLAVSQMLTSTGAGSTMQDKGSMGYRIEPRNSMPDKLPSPCSCPSDGSDPSSSYCVHAAPIIFTFLRLNSRPPNPFHSPALQPSSWNPKTGPAILHRSGALV